MAGQTFGVVTAAAIMLGGAVMLGAGTDPVPATPAKDAAATEATGPGVLASGVGVWDVQATLWLTPGAEPQRTTATCTSRMILGGMFLEERMEGGTLATPGGRTAWESVSHTGLDAGRKTFQVNRMSSTSPVMMPETGAYDPESKTLETRGEFTIASVRLAVRTVGRTISPDERIIEQYMSFNGSPEYKGIELKMKRRK